MIFVKWMNNNVYFNYLDMLVTTFIYDFNPR